MNTNLAKKAARVAEVVVEPVTPAEVAAPVLTIVKDETEVKPGEVQAPAPFIAPWATAPEVKEEPRNLSLEEKIQRVEDLTLLIERFRALAESRRKLQTFPYRGRLTQLHHFASRCFWQRVQNLQFSGDYLGNR